MAATKTKEVNAEVAEVNVPVKDPFDCPPDSAADSGQQRPVAVRMREWARLPDSTRRDGICSAVCERSA